MDILLLLAMGSSGGESSAGGGVGMLFLFGGLFLIWWFLFLRPQIKRQKDRQKMVEALKKGDRVATRGGIIGVIIGVKEKENIVVVKIAENVKVEVLKSAVEGVVGEPEKEKDKGK